VLTTVLTTPANRYQSETSFRRTLEKLKTRKRERLDWEIRYNSIANLEKIMASFQKDEGNLKKVCF
jgi:hypothetical protein